MICILYHAYNLDSLNEFVRYINNIKFKNDVYVNLIKSENQQYDRNRVKSALPRAKIIFSENRGMDIGGTLKLFQHVRSLKIRYKYKYILKIHSKSCARWRREMCQPILGSPSRVKEIVNLFENNQDIGLIGSMSYFRDIEKDRYKDMVKEICKEYDFDPKGCFLAGTIFWVRYGIFDNLFSQIDVDKIFEEFEKGYMSDEDELTPVHAWERIFGLIVNHEGFDYWGATKSNIKPRKVYCSEDLYSYFLLSVYLDNYPELSFNSRDEAIRHWKRNKQEYSCIAKDFDWRVYLKNYPDLKEKIKTEKTAWKHYTQNRWTYIDKEFDWKEYAEYRPYLKNQKQAWRHNIENRIEIPEIEEEEVMEEVKKPIKKFDPRFYFDFDIYIKNYPELIDQGIRNRKQAIIHWENNRDKYTYISKSFNWKEYQKRHPHKKFHSEKQAWKDYMKIRLNQ